MKKKRKLSKQTSQRQTLLGKNGEVADHCEVLASDQFLH